MNPNILFVPFFLASIFSLFSKKEKTVKIANWIFSLIGGISFISYALPFVFGSKERWQSTWFLMDSFSALLVALVSVVYILSIIISIRYIGHEYREKIIAFSQYRMYFSLFHMFVLCMIVAVMTNNSLVLWLALEGTTLFSTFLVGLYRRKTSIEAAWKYMILCSTGISLGLVGILLLSYGAHVGGATEGNIFSLTYLMQNAGLIPHDIIKLAFIFLFIGFGTKVGLVPMHTWLPDAHSKAPSPVSAIFSAVLLNVALYGMLRFKFIADSAFSDSSWTNHLFLIFGFLSVLLSAFMMLIQSNYKRMLAYSSIEHMGIILFSIGLSPLGAVAGVMHMIGHTFAKSALFFGAGEILIQWKTTKVEKIKNMLQYSKYTSFLFIAGVVAIIAIPPSGLFVSEYAMFSQSIILHPIVSIFFFIALGIIAYAMLAVTMRMIFQADENDKRIDMKKEKWNLTHSIIVGELIMVALLAWWFTTSGANGIIRHIVEAFLFIK